MDNELPLSQVTCFLTLSNWKLHEGQEYVLFTKFLVYSNCVVVNHCRLEFLKNWLVMCHLLLMSKAKFQGLNYICTHTLIQASTYKYQQAVMCTHTYVYSLKLSWGRVTTEKKCPRNPSYFESSQPWCQPDMWMSKSSDDSSPGHYLQAYGRETYLGWTPEL